MILFPYEEPDLARDRQDLIAYAEAGHAPSQRVLGDCYRIGDDLTKRDYVEALRWYRCAAEQGDPEAQNDLGSMYLNGFGVAKDATEAARWYRKSAEQGVAMAMFHFALRCLHGDGVERDDAEAVLWLSKAAEQGHIAATGLLGTCYRFSWYQTEHRPSGPVTREGRDSRRRCLDRQPRRLPQSNRAICVDRQTPRRSMFGDDVPQRRGGREEPRNCIGVASLGRETRPSRR